MIIVRHELDIAAPPIKVWRALTDFRGYARWNPVREIEGAPALGAKVVLKIGSDPLKRRALSAKIIAFDPGKMIAFRSGFKPWMSAVESFELEASPRGTRLRHSSQTEGLGSVLLAGPDFERDVQAIYQRVDSALAKFCAQSPKPRRA